MTNHRIRLCCGFLAILFCASCGPDYVLDERHTFPEGQWAYADSLSFSASIRDTLSLYNLYLDIDHGVEEFPFQNLYVRIHTIFPGGQRLTETVSLELANRAGAWHGDCNAKACQLRITLQENAFFEQAGDYSFVVEQYTRRNPLPGVRAIGFAIEAAGDKKGRI
jgi:gliding motility-associated lipoprotein GldH